jgi:hypothetical protein
MMSELRWALLIAGVVFIAALAWWERRRPRQASGALPRAAPREAAGGREAHPAREPPLTLPSVRAREPLGAPGLPVIEFPEEPRARPAGAAPVPRSVPDPDAVPGPDLVPEPDAAAQRDMVPEPDAAAERVVLPEPDTVPEPDGVAGRAADAGPAEVPTVAAAG